MYSLFCNKELKENKAQIGSGCVDARGRLYTANSKSEARNLYHVTLKADFKVKGDHTFIRGGMSFKLSCEIYLRFT